MVSTYDVMFITNPQGYLPTLARYIRSTVPCLAAGATFAAVTCASTSLRGKDDKINYFIGGASAGGVFGVAGKSFSPRNIVYFVACAKSNRGLLVRF